MTHYAAFAGMAHYAAFAGMTGTTSSFRDDFVIPAKAGIQRIPAWDDGS